MRELILLQLISKSMSYHQVGTILYLYAFLYLCYKQIRHEENYRVYQWASTFKSKYIPSSQEHLNTFLSINKYSSSKSVDILLWRDVNQFYNDSVRVVVKLFCSQFILVEDAASLMIMSLHCTRYSWLMHRVLILYMSICALLWEQPKHCYGSNLFDSVDEWMHVVVNSLSLKL